MLVPANRQHLITKMSPITYNAAAVCPQWELFLNRIFAGNSALIEFVQKVFGYCLTGAVTEKALFVLYGPGGDNGKTTMLEAIRHVMGDYSCVVDVDHLMDESGSAATERAIAELAGKRFATSSEAGEGQRMKEAKIKWITGMNRLTGRKIYGTQFEYNPHFKLFIDANHKPVIRGEDNAIWNRIRLIPFSVSIPRAEQDKKLGEKLRAEASGILTWMLQGCLKWRQDGLGSPAAVTRAGEQYREQMDVVSDFIEDCCLQDSEAYETSFDLYDAYRRWCATKGDKPISSTAFGRRLAGKGLTETRRGGSRGRTGIKLVQAALIKAYDDAHSTVQ
jgi:putative DNA primase/helicase